ncbi:MAG: VTC domain-containing protein [Deltaproteobacteria bacterium]|nr:VTC domain-containing protein [Deltaproteobacteria bacterium]
MITVRLPELFRKRNPLRASGELTSSFAYYEYKYLVPHGHLSRVRDLLEEFLGESDPYPSGIVDSVYYDSCDESCLSQCENGDAEKAKFRIRGYGDGYYRQIHQKMKHLSAVDKYKQSIFPVQALADHAPAWDSLEAQAESDAFDRIICNSRQLGFLIPSIRVCYERFRYRSYDERITLDTNIEVFALINGLPRALSWACFPYHVLELKTRKERPVLPFVGLLKLQQVSFSKFMIGIRLLSQT